METFRTAACLALLLPLMGIAQSAPAGAVPAAPVQITPLTRAKTTTLRTVDCRRYVHTHRRCMLWSSGYCRRWVTYSHVCG